MLPAALDDLTTTTGILLLTAIAICFIPLLSYLRYLITSPGPWGIPVLGYYPFLREDYYVHLYELAKKHGDVYLLNIAGQTFLHLSSMEAVREAHVNKEQFFSGRSSNHSMFSYTFGKGILYVKGEEWRSQRKFFVQSMKQVGLGASKEELRGSVYEAVVSTINTLRESKGKPLDLSTLFSKECSSAVTRLILGDDVSEEEVAKLLNAYFNISVQLARKDILLTGTFAKYFLLPRTPSYSIVIEGKKEMENVLFKILQRHKMKFDVEKEPRDLIDFYLRESAIRKKKGDSQAKYFSDSSLISSITQIYGDGSLSIAYLIASFLQRLALHRKTQDELFKEIIEVIGTEKWPTWEDRLKLPLMHATIKELFRLMTLFPAFPDMECTKETSVLGVRVPKGCMTLESFYGVNHDPRKYKNPEKFDPARFLPGPSKEEDPLIFGVGKRVCIGEGLVMTEVFMFLGSLLQSFVFLPETESDNEPGEPVGDPTQCKLRVIPRSSIKAN